MSLSFCTRIINKILIFNMSTKQCKMSMPRETCKLRKTYKRKEEIKLTQQSNPYRQNNSGKYKGEIRMNKRFHSVFLLNSKAKTAQEGFVCFSTLFLAYLCIQVLIFTLCSSRCPYGTNIDIVSSDCTKYKGSLQFDDFLPGLSF